MITRSWAWNPGSTPAPFDVPGSVQVNTNGRGAVVYIVPSALPARGAAVPADGQFALTMRRPKLMMDPLDTSTWQRTYRFT